MANPFPDPARRIVRDFAKGYTHTDHRGEFAGQEALALKLGYKWRESITPWFRGLDTGRTDGRTTPPADARHKLWAVMDHADAGMLDAVASQSAALRREIRETRARIAAGAYADARPGATFARPRPAVRLGESV